MTSSRPRLELVGVSKTFGPNRVLSGVDLVVGPGEIRGLAGQNGSGKSTLIKILTGIYAPDPGSRIAVDGSPLHLPVRWSAARRAGIGVVHQDLGLLDHLTVAENICVGGYPVTRSGRIDRRARDRLAESTLDRIGVHVSPRALVAELTAAERAEVAIARAMRAHAPGRGLTILDESTRSLRGADLERIHALLRRIVDGGSSAIIISHSLRELTTIADAVTVLRDGHVTADLSRSAGDVSEAAIAQAMLGDTLAAFHRSRTVTQDRPDRSSRVVIRGLTGGPVRDVSFEIGRGEILGITGAPGGGHDEMAGLLAGDARPAAGQMVVDDRTIDLPRASITSILRAGVMLVPERRDRDGLAMEMSIRDNVTLPQLAGRRRLFLNRPWQSREAGRIIRKHGVRPSSPHALIRELSGGNQQKVLLAKWLEMRPRFLILHEPTQAVDVGARREILTNIATAAHEGTSILVVSSEVDDLTAICDRVLIHGADGLTPADATNSTQLLDQVFAPTTRTLP